MTHGETGRQYLQHTARLRSGCPQDTRTSRRDGNGRPRKTAKHFKHGKARSTSLTVGEMQIGMTLCCLPLPAQRASGVWKAVEAQGGAPEGPWPPAPRQWESNAARRLRRHQANAVTHTLTLPSGSAPGRPSSRAQLGRGWGTLQTAGCDRGEVNVRESEVRPAQRRSAGACAGRKTSASVRRRRDGPRRERHRPRIGSPYGCGFTSTRGLGLR